MLKEFVWNTFEKTGNVDLYVFFREIEAKNRGISEHNTAVEEAAISNSFKDAIPV